MDSSGVTISVYTYDSNGNRLSHATQTDTVQGTYDSQDRMLTYGDASYGYSANGSLTYKVVGTDTTWYDYDLLGNLISVTLPDDTFIEYIIDGQNRRVGKKVNDVFQKGWLYQDQLNPVVELDENGDPALGFVYGTKGHVPDFMVTPDSSYRFITDHLGSVRLVVNAETGIVRQRLEYDEFGNVIVDTNPGFQPFGYAGGLYDEETGLVRFGARDYDAETGRWTAKDPIRFTSGTYNVYVYSRNNPICKIDPSGLTDYVITVTRMNSIDFSDYMTIAVDGLTVASFFVHSTANIPGYYSVPSNRTYEGFFSNSPSYSVGVREDQLYLYITDPCENNKVDLGYTQPKTGKKYKEGNLLHYGEEGKSAGCILFRTQQDEDYFYSYFDPASDNVMIIINDSYPYVIARGDKTAVIY